MLKSHVANKNVKGALKWVAPWVGVILQSKSWLVQLPVRACAWAVSSVRFWGMYQWQPSVFLSLSFSLPSPLSKSKFIQSFKK